MALSVALFMIDAFGGARPGFAQDSSAAEVTSEESHPTFELHVQRNEVLARVVVRDAKGEPVGNLQKEDFRIFDNRKPQVITHFAMETSTPSPGTEKGPSATTGAPVLNGESGSSATPIVLPHRFMALYFDDVHLEFGDLVRNRDAADLYLAGNLQPGDRAAIFTSSGQNQLDFTSDRDKLHDDLLSLRPRAIFPADRNACLQISPYQAYKMVELHDSPATEEADLESYQCNCLDEGITQPTCQQIATGLADNEAARSLADGESESRYALTGLDRICRRLALVPGQRNMVLVSPGFITVTQLFDVSQIIDEALRDNIVINTLDARGLYTVNALGDVTGRVTVIPARPDLMAAKAEIRLDSVERDADVLEELADGTGGAYFHNSNDFAAGLRRVGAFPGAYYVLAFAPEDLKTNGRFHILKVSLANNPNHLTLQARRGYFAPDKNEDTATVAKERLEQEVFSQEEQQTIPVEVHTQFFKASSGQNSLAVLTHVDIKGVHFRKADGRNLDDLTLVTALFDQAGNYITGEEKRVQFHLRDSTLARLSETGLMMKSSLAVKPGTYLVREVVRESEGDQLSALNSQVEIP